MNARRPPLQALFMTGQSDPRGCRLSPSQRGFLRRLDLAPGEVCALNFPYRATSAPYRATALPIASWHNARQYLLSRRAGFAAAYADDVLARLACAEHTLLLAGSCGLELLNNLRLPRGRLAALSVFAYGPVARRRPDGCRRLWLVQGERDRLSQRFFRADAVDHRVGCGHRDYLETPALLTLCRAFVDQVRAGTRS